MDLDRGHEHRLRLLAVDRQVDKSVLTRVSAKLLEVVGVDRDARGIDAVAVDDGREAAGVAKAGDLLAGQLTMFGGKRRSGGGHVVGTSDAVSGSFGLRLGRRAGVARRPDSVG